VPYIVKVCKKKSSNYEYLINTKNEYPEPDEIIEEFENAGFKFVKRKDFFFGAISVQIMQK
jgi:ubiquinone/menaquinone biosynthesis C-methylase UbiE